MVQAGLLPQGQRLRHGQDGRTDHQFHDHLHGAACPIRSHVEYPSPIASSTGCALSRAWRSPPTMKASLPSLAGRQPGYSGVQERHPPGLCRLRHLLRRRSLPCSSQSGAARARPSRAPLLPAPLQLVCHLPDNGDHHIRPPGDLGAAPGPADAKRRERLCPGWHTVIHCRSETSVQDVLRHGGAMAPMPINPTLSLFSGVGPSDTNSIGVLSLQWHFRVSLHLPGCSPEVL